jgi:hypothetical protein
MEHNSDSSLRVAPPGGETLARVKGAERNLPKGWVLPRPGKIRGLLTHRAKLRQIVERHFSAISVKNSKACHISSLSAESQRIAMKVPTLAMPLMTG